jgi:hypothetical protein
MALLPITPYFNFLYPEYAIFGRIVLNSFKYIKFWSVLALVTVRLCLIEALGSLRDYVLILSCSDGV